MKAIIRVVVLLMTTLLPAYAVEPPVTVPLGKDGVQRIEITGGEYFFKPAHIVVKVNVPVELRVRKEGYVVPHNLVIEAPDAGIKVNESLSRDPKPITFTPTKVGIYPMYCDKKLLFLDSHREKGMEGIVEVVE